MNATTSNFKVSKVEITRAEGPSVLCGITHTFSYLSGANAILRRWAWAMPENQRGYDKCDFRVTFTDGDTYEGRFDLQVTDRNTVDLKAHMVEFVKYLANNGNQDAIEALPKYQAL